MVFEGLAEQASRTLNGLSELVLSLPKPETFSAEFASSALDPDLEPLGVTSTVVGWVKKGYRFIYYFTAEADAEQLLSIRRAYSDAKNHELGGRAYARLNEPPSQTFYVGSSGALGRRVKEHLGYGARATYALHLAAWARELDLRLRLNAARFPPTVNESLIGLLEDELWDRLRPMFGRKGRR